MKIKWYGHAAFLITSGAGVRVITDPYESGGYDGKIAYGPIPDEGDVVTVSHDHGDHNHVAGIRGTPQVLRGVGSWLIQEIPFKGVATFHDTVQGAERGPNTIFAFEVDGIRVCHLGDLGHSLSEEELNAIGPVDLLLTPVGGRPATLEPQEMTELVERISPRLVIPMHFKTPKIDFPFKPLEEFLQEKENVRSLHVTERTLNREELPSSQEVWVLDYAL